MADFGPLRVVTKAVSQSESGECALLFWAPSTRQFQTGCICCRVLKCSQQFCEPYFYPAVSSPEYIRGDCSPLNTPPGGGELMESEVKTLNFALIRLLRNALFTP